MVVELPPSRWELPDPRAADGDLVALGADLEPATILDGYRAGLFPMRLSGGGPLAWWSPDPRGVIPLDGFRVSRSLRRS
ncbi:MAG: leucyl/phenylalanyl-tRNA--protein transferase, partial [Actinobacteria bacterium]|nr:leucyl/phenylalanyl-tRNA--protein transferase [Actinomycetota bacterium]